MSETVTVSMTAELKDRVEEYQGSNHFNSRSSAAADLIRRGVEESTREGEIIVDKSHLSLMLSAIVGLLLGVLAAVSPLIALTAVGGAVAGVALVAVALVVSARLTPPDSAEADSV